MKKNKRVFVLLSVLTAILILSFLFSVFTGSNLIPVKEALAGLFDSENEYYTVMMYIRLPRTLGALLSGIGLSVAGVLLQSVTNNRLASPGIIGVNSGAGLAVITFMSFSGVTGVFIPFAAFSGAVVAASVILAIAGKAGNRESSVILAGMAVNAILNALISFVSLINTDILSSYNYFSIGGLSGIEIESLILPAVFIFASLTAALLLARKISLMCLGDTVASSLGVNIRVLRTVCVICACACAASVVSFAGLLGFVGLIVPNMARKLFGGNTFLCLVCSALLGGSIVLLADTLGRTLLSPTEIPVGIVMALIGAPFFLILVLRRKKNA